MDGSLPTKGSLRRARLLLGAVMFSSAILLPPAIATEVDCQGGHKCQTCAGTEECKALEMSGRCRGPITCGNPNEPCACVVNIRAKTDSLDQKKPLGKSQR